jgi:hypothetical protein
MYIMVFNATFNNISVISWQSVLLMEETRLFRENLYKKYMKFFKYCKFNIYFLKSYRNIKIAIKLNGDIEN